jgi:HAMP domain-containing protein
MAFTRPNGLRRQTYFYLGFLAIVFGTMAFEVTFLIRGPRVEGAIKEAVLGLEGGSSDIVALALAPLDLVLKKFGVALAILLATIILVMLLLMKRITIPLESILTGTRRMGAGDFSATIPIQTHDELGSLADCINGISVNHQELLLLTGDLSSRARDALHVNEAGKSFNGRERVELVLSELDEILDEFGKNYYGDNNFKPPPGRPRS